MDTKILLFPVQFFSVAMKPFRGTAVKVFGRFLALAEGLREGNTFPERVQTKEKQNRKVPNGT